MLVSELTLGLNFHNIFKLVRCVIEWATLIIILTYAIICKDISPGTGMTS